MHNHGHRRRHHHRHNNLKNNTTATITVVALVVVVADIDQVIAIITVLIMNIFITFISIIVRISRVTKCAIVSIKVAGYSGLVLSSPFILYQIIQFVLPGLTRRERRLLGPVVLGSSVLFVAGLVFAYLLLIPAALNFFISYGEDVVDQFWSIDKYFEFVLLLLFSTGLAFQIPIIQLLLGNLGIVSSQMMISGWRYVIMAAVVLGAILTPSTDPLTQSLLAGAVLGLYFGGIGLVKLTGK